MGAVGSEARGGRKTRQTEAQMVAQGMFDTLWPGKFPKKKYARAGIEGARMDAAVAAAAEK